MMIWTTVKWRELERTHRIDAEFYRPELASRVGIIEAGSSDSLTNVATVSDGNHASISTHFSREGVRYLRGQDVTDFFIRDSSPVYIPEALFQSRLLRRSHMQPMDILVSIVGTIGAVALVPTGVKRLTGSCKIAIVRPHAIDPYYLAAFLLSSFGRAQFRRHTRGAVQTGLVLEDFDQIRVTIPSGRLVQRVRGLIEDAHIQHELAKTLFREACDSALNELGYKPADPHGFALVSAGEVVQSRRMDAEFFRSDGMHSTSPVDGAGSLLDITTSITSGVTPKPDEYAERGVPIMKVEGIDSTGTAAATAFVGVDWARDNQKGRVRRGDVLILAAAHHRSYIGRAGLVVDDVGPSASAVGEVIVMRLREGVSPAAVVTYLNLPPVRRAIQRLVRGNTAHLYPRDLVSLPAPRFGSKVIKGIEEKFGSSISARSTAQRYLRDAVGAVEHYVEQHSRAGGR